MTPNSAQVRLLTDQQSAASAVVVETRATGVVLRGQSDDSLILDRVPKNERASRPGTSSSRPARGSAGYESLFPRGIPICVVASASQRDIDLYKTDPVHPARRLRLAARGVRARCQGEAEAVTVVDTAEDARALLRRGPGPGHASSRRLEVARGHPDLVLVFARLGRARCAARCSGPSPASGRGSCSTWPRCETLGLTSLLLTLAGYWSGRFGEATTRRSPHPPLIAVGLATVWAVVGAGVPPLHARAGRLDVGSPRAVLLPDDRPEPPARVPGLPADVPALPARSARAAGGGACLALPDFLPPDPRVEEPVPRHAADGGPDRHPRRRSRSRSSRRSSSGSGRSR